MQNELQKMKTKDEKTEKQKRTKLVAIKQIPGLFLKKKINRRTKTSNMKRFEDNNIKETEEKQFTQCVEQEHSKNEERHVQKTSGTKPKLTDGPWTKEWLDDQRCQKNLERNDKTR